MNITDDSRAPGWVSVSESLVYKNDALRGISESSDQMALASVHSIMA